VKLRIRGGQRLVGVHVEATREHGHGEQRVSDLLPDRPSIARRFSPADSDSTSASGSSESRVIVDSTVGSSVAVNGVCLTVVGREPEALASCYRESLRLASEHGLASVAFPSIATGIYGYPVAAAAKVALTAVRAFLVGEPTTVSLVRFTLWSDEDFATYRSELTTLPD